MYRFNISMLVLFFCLLNNSCRAESFDFSSPCVFIVSNGDKQSAAAADYLFNHLNRKNINKDAFTVLRSDDPNFDIEGVTLYLEVVPDLEYDYEIINRKEQLSLFGKDRATLRWLSYMLIDHLSNFHQLDVADLPPNYLEFNTSKVNFAFHYRDPHLMPNMDQDISGILYTQNVDEDWGLWGHNLRKVFPDGPSLNSLALVSGKRDAEQYCFSSEATLKAIHSFVIDQYGFGQNQDGKWFMISPNDNDKVCTCDTCLAQGNTETDASPAVVNLLNKLALKFPNHHFYTTSYRTTKKAPSIDLLPNTGVLLSTIDLSKAPNLQIEESSVREFTKSLEDWNQRSAKLYLWDYISNFDDYLTPFPVLFRAQSQFKYFKELGVDGLFLNGSGYDYTPFEDVKTYVLSAIMIDLNLSIPDLVKSYFKRFYPKTGTLLSDYYLSLESKAYVNNANISLYTPFDQTMQSYLNVDEFLEFYQKLKKMQKLTIGEERKRIDKLLAALSYVQMQLNYHQGTIDNGFLTVDGGNVKLALQNDENKLQLQKLIKQGVLNYKEEKGDLRTYLKEWDLLENRKTPINKLKEVKAIGLSTGTVLPNADLLINNLPGFVSDFNQGWFLTGEDVQIQCDNLKDEVKELNLTFLINRKHRMLAPEEIVVKVDNTVIGCYNTTDYTLKENKATLNKKIVIPENKKLEIIIYKNRELKNSVIACDEIQLY